MATVIRTPPFQAPSVPTTRTVAIPLKASKPFCISFRQRHISSSRFFCRTNSPWFASVQSLRFVKFVPLASTGETETTETEQEIQEPKVEDSSDGAVAVEDDASDDDRFDAEAPPTSVILETLQLYKEALGSNDVAKVAEIEAFLKSIEDEKIDLESKVANFSDELTVERDRVLRISADFDNFRKRTERERLSLVTNAQGEVVERLLQVLDNFDRAKTQIKVQTEGEEKINNSYQSIYKQLLEILGSLGVVSVETVGNPFDPLDVVIKAEDALETLPASYSIVVVVEAENTERLLHCLVKLRVGLKFSRVLDEFYQKLNQLHEAIMREDSEEFKEGVIVEEFRKGFKLGDRLLRPSMVKVSAGPGPAKPKEVEPSEGGADAESSTAEVEAESS